ncbi:neurofilament medium polypeptide-like [Patiria miniata]|uniref:Uncharacterized protein n=1 Tax=Patiria miniata TaxID=46514 RepID=A0A913ZR17_PATMI|nr:neurofilament medium polypeptide-like [Patiria miniata]
MIPSDEQQRTSQEVRGQSHKRKPEVQVGGAKVHRSKEESTSPEGLLRQEEMVQPKSSVQVGGDNERNKQKGTPSSERQRPGQGEDGYGDEPQPDVEVGETIEQSKHKKTATSEGQRPRREDVTHQDTPQPEVQAEDAEEQSKQKRTVSSEGLTSGHEKQDQRQRREQEILEKRGRQKQMTPCAEEQRLGQEEVPEEVNQVASQSTSFKNRFKRSFYALLPKRKKKFREQNSGQEQAGDEHSRQADNQRAGFHEERKKKEGTSSSEGHSPRQEDVGHRDTFQKDVLVGVAKEHIKQKGTASSEDQRPRLKEISDGDKPQTGVQVGGAKEQCQQKGSTSSEEQRQKQQEACGTESIFQKERMQSSQDHGIKSSTHQKQGHGHVDFTLRKPSEIQETVVGERTSQDQLIMQGPSSVQDIAPVELHLQGSSPSPAVLGCGPVQQVSVESMHIGGTNNPTFMGPVYQPTVVINQNVTTESSPGK